jgi:hypothetical protein
MTKTIARVLGFAATDAGHAVEIEVEFSDATANVCAARSTWRRASFRC